MLKSDVENAQEIAELLFQLTQHEGDSVEIYHPNADYDGPNSGISMKTNYDEHTEYFGESVLDCLRQASAARRITKEKS